jgi:hypothetical protein
LLSLFMMIIVAGGIYRLMVTVYRVTRKQTEISNVQGNLRAGMQLVQSELQEIYTDAALGQSDIVTPGATLIQYSSMRGIGETCGLVPGEIHVRQLSYSGRKPATGRDQLLLFQDRDTLTQSDDVWLTRPITEVQDGTCPVGDPDPSWILAVPALVADDLVEPVAGTPLIFAPGPLRTIELMEMGLVTDGGKDWLGIRAVGITGEDALVPVIGPLATGGLAFEYRDGSATITAVPTAVKTIVVKLWGISAQSANTNLGSTVGNFRDSVVVRVQLRNSR